MYDFLRYVVEEAMTRNPMTISQDATVADAEAIFEEHDFNGLPVVDDLGHLVGLITKLDLLGVFRFTQEETLPPYERLMRTRVGDVMDSDVATVKTRTPLTRVLERLVRTRYKSLVVEEDGYPVGMIAREDVLAALKRAVAAERAGLAERAGAAAAGPENT